MNLNKRERNVLSLIRDFHIENGKYPTKTEIGELVGAKNPRQVGYWYCKKFPHKIEVEKVVTEKTKVYQTSKLYNRVVIDWKELDL